MEKLIIRVRYQVMMWRLHGYVLRLRRLYRRNQKRIQLIEKWIRYE